MTETFVGLDRGWIASNVEIGGATPQDVAFAGFIGTGQMSRNARWSLDWGTNSGPSSIVVKIPSADETVRNISFEHGIYQKECAFYRSVKALTDVAAPELIALHMATDDFCLVLEDLAGSRQGDQFTEATDEQLALAIDQAAALHAPVWGAVDQPVFDPFRDDPEERAAESGERMAFFHAVVLDRLGAGLDADVADLLPPSSNSRPAMWAVPRR